MKIGISYFSGTGNTALLANTIAETLHNSGQSVQIISMEDNKFFQENNFDCFVFASPKYYEYIPLFILDWIKQNVPVQTKSTKGVFISCGGAGMKTGYKTPIKILRSKNIETVITKTIKMPVNFTLKSTKEVDKDACNIMIENAKARAVQIAKKIIEGNFELEKCNPLMELLCQNVSKSFCKKAWKTAAKFSVTEKCNSCKLCIEKCPMQNISIDKGTIHFGDKCSSCLRCINLCPNKAIYYDKKEVPQYRLTIDKIR